MAGSRSTTRSEEGNVEVDCVLRGQGRGRWRALRAGSRRWRGPGTGPWTAGGGGTVVSRATAVCEVKNLPKIC
jgi:hypothetical protein